MIKDTDFIDALYIALRSKTLYVKGGFGLLLNKKNKDRCINAYAYNEKRANRIYAMPSDSFGFDCCGLVKGCAGGFYGDTKKTYGGAIYNADHTLGEDHDVPDVNEKGLIERCVNVTKCRKIYSPDIPAASLLWMTGHCGIYLGNNIVIESTPSGSDGVQLTQYDDKNWMKWGLLPFVSYDIVPDNKKPVLAKPTLRNGSKGLQVYYIQEDLNYLGEVLETDGQFGPLTLAAVKKFQKNHNLVVDGIYGPKSYGAMMEALK